MLRCDEALDDDEGDDDAKNLRSPKVDERFSSSRDGRGTGGDGERDDGEAECASGGDRVGDDTVASDADIGDNDDVF